MKRIAIFLAVTAALLAFTGCFGPDTSGSSSSSGTEQAGPSAELKSYDNGEIFITFPSNWEIIQPKDFTSEVPEETQVVIRNNVKNETYTANTNVVKNIIRQGTSTIDYAKDVLSRQKNGLIGYRELSRDLVNIQIGGQNVETYRVVFEAKLNPEDPTLRFEQTYGVKGTSGYIILGATSLQETTTVVNSVSDTVKSFRIN